MDLDRGNRSDQGRFYAGYSPPGTPFTGNPASCIGHRAGIGASTNRPKLRDIILGKGGGPRERSPHAGRRALEQPTTNNHCNLPDGQCEPSESKEVRTHQPNAEVTWQQFAGTVPSPTSCRTPKNGRGGRSSTPLCGITDLIGDSAKLLVINVTVSR